MNLLYFNYKEVPVCPRLVILLVSNTPLEFKLNTRITWQSLLT